MASVGIKIRRIFQSIASLLSEAKLSRSHGGNGGRHTESHLLPPLNHRECFFFHALNMDELYPALCRVV